MKSCQKDEVCHITPAKALIIQFHLHLLTNNHWLADFLRYSIVDLIY